MKKQEETAIEPGVSLPLKPQSSREPLFGTILLIFMAVIFLGVVAGIVWGGYHGWRLNKEEAALTSIEGLAVKETLAEEAKNLQKENQVNSPEQPTSESSSEDQVLVKAQVTEIKVLNGGAVKGSAGTTVEFLKKAGYTKVTAGNTIGNYVGTTIYFSVGFDAEGAALKEGLMSVYPKIEVKPSVKENKETAQASLTVILGK